MLTLGYSGGGGGRLPFDHENGIFVDSVRGSDSDNGSWYAPFQTIGAAETSALAYGDGAKLYIIGGSNFEEGLDLTTLDNVQVLGLEGLSTLDGSDVVTSWSASGTANVYQASVTWTGLNTSDRGVVYEDGEMLVRVDDIATCSSTPGSFVNIRGSQPSPWTVQIHPSDGGNPTSNGKEYRVSNRKTVLNAGSATVKDLHFTRGAANNGPLDLVNADSSFIERCVASFGTKHNLGHGPGTVRDSIAIFSDPPTSYETSNTLFVAYHDTATGKSITWDRCFAVDIESTSGVSAFYMHGTISENNFAVASNKRCAVIGSYSAFSGYSEQRVIEDCYVSATSTSIAGQSIEYIIRRSMFDMSDPGAAGIYHSGPRVITGEPGFSMTFEDTVFYSADSSSFAFFLLRDNGSYTFHNCVFYTGASRGKFTMSGINSSAFSVNNCIFYGPGNWMLDIPAGCTYEGDNNVFHNPSGTLPLRFAGSSKTTLAAWQSATGQDANSSEAAPGFSGTVANGDFRLTPAGVADAIGAGISQYYDWNAGAVVDGAPASWPTIPLTVPQSLTYAADPAAWDFYP